MAFGINKFYLHDAVSDIDGHPSLSAGSYVTTGTKTATGAATARVMDQNIGTAQTSVAITSDPVTTAQFLWLRRFVSPTLAGSTPAAGRFFLTLAGAEANAAMNLALNGFTLTQWRPGVGSVGTLCNSLGTVTTEPGTTETALSGATWFAAHSAATFQVNDRLILEMWGYAVQSMTSAYVATAYYDGTTEASITSNAAFLQHTDGSNNPVNLNFSQPQQRPRACPRVTNPAIQQSSYL